MRAPRSRLARAPRRGHPFTLNRSWSPLRLFPSSLLQLTSSCAPLLAPLSPHHHPVAPSPRALSALTGPAYTHSPRLYSLQPSPQHHTSRPRQRPSCTINLLSVPRATRHAPLSRVAAPPRPGSSLRSTTLPPPERAGPAVPSLSLPLDTLSSTTMSAPVAPAPVQKPRGTGRPSPLAQLAATRTRSYSLA